MIDNSRPDSLWRLVGRAVGYASTAACAHVAGYLLQAKARHVYDLLLIGSLWAVSLPFYLYYALSYSFPHRCSTVPDDARRATQTATRQVLPILVGTIAILLVVSYIALMEHTPPTGFWIAFAGFSIVPFCYGLYTSSRHERGILPIMRHQLVWPVVLSITLPLYAGIVFSATQSAALLVPPGCLLIFFFFSLYLEKRTFIISSLGIAAILFALIIFDIDIFFLAFRPLAIYLAVAAYLAVFEAWRITAYLAKQEQTVPQEMQRAHVVVAHESSKLPSERYYMATAVALCVAGLLLPLAYVFSTSGRLFLWGAVPHAIGAFALWYWAGGKKSQFVTTSWVLRKTMFGFAFLGILVIDALSGWQATQRFLPSFVDKTTLFGFAGFALGLVGLQYHNDIKDNPTSWLRHLSRHRAALPVLLILLATSLGFATLVIEDLAQQEDRAGVVATGATLLIAKSDRVFCFYIVVLILCMLMVIGKDGVSALRGLFVSALAYFLLGRVFTSGMIGLAVLLPGLVAGAPPTDVSLWALPFFLAAAGGFGLNDYFDYERDCINKPYRPLPAQRLPRRSGLVFGCLVLAIGLGITLAVENPWQVRALQVAALAGSAFYSVVVIRWGAAKWIYTALLCLSPVIFVLVVFSHRVADWFVALALLLLIAGREILMDLLDERGDRLTGLRTLPVLWGRKSTTRLGIGLLSLSAVPLLAFVCFASSPTEKFVVAGALLLVGCGVGLWQGSSATRQRNLVRSAWLPMILMFCLILF